VRAAARVGVTVEAEMAPSRFLVDAMLRRRAGWSSRRLLRFLGGLRQAAYNAVLAGLGGRSVLSRQWQPEPGGPDQVGRPVLRTVTGIEPLFGSWRDVLVRPVPFYHVRPLREWQARVAAAGVRLDGSAGAAPEQRGDAQPPDRADPHAAGAGGDLDQGLVAE